MKRYIGIKIIHAENGNAPRDMGKHKAGEDGMTVVYEDGYESWSPQDVFDNAYRECDALPFGLAIEAAKKGFKVARKGWNGKGMYVVYQKGYPEGIPINKNTADATGLSEGTVCQFRPYLMMKTVNENEFVPWLASQTDMLADDWMVVE